MNTKYPLRKKEKNLKPVSIEVPAWRAGIAIAAHDLIDGSHNKHGLYKLEMWVDDDTFIIKYPMIGFY